MKVFLTIYIYASIILILILMLSVCTNNHSKFLVCENYLVNKAILILILTTF